MNKFLTGAATSCVALLLSPLATAVTLNISPATQTVTVGDTFTATVDILGLAAGGAPSLGGFDFSLFYDSSIIGTDADNNVDTPADTDVIFGTDLNTLPDRGFNQFAEFVTFDAVCAGATLCLNAAEFSEEDVEPNSNFFTLQPADFTLLTVTFTANALGTVNLDFLTDVVLFDEDGIDLTIDALNGAVVNVIAAAPVPVPASIALLATGLLSLRIRSARRKYGSGAVLN